MRNQKKHFFLVLFMISNFAWSQKTQAITPELGLPIMFEQIDGPAKASLTRVGPKKENTFLLLVDNIDSPLSGVPVLVLREASSSDLESARLWHRPHGGTKGFSFHDEKKQLLVGGSIVRYWSLYEAEGEPIKMRPSKEGPLSNVAQTVWKKYLTSNGIDSERTVQADIEKAVKDAFSKAKSACGLRGTLKLEWASFEKNRAIPTAKAASHALKAFSEVCSDADYKSALSKLSRIEFTSSSGTAGLKVIRKGEVLTISLSLAPGNVIPDTKKGLEDSL
jgi:hypothetical protein